MTVNGQLHPQPRCLRPNSFRQPLNKRLGWLHNRLGSLGEEKKKPVSCLESKLRSPSSQSDTILTKLTGAAVRTGIMATLKVTMMIIIIVTSRDVRVFQLEKNNLILFSHKARNSGNYAVFCSSVAATYRNCKNNSICLITNTYQRLT